MTARNPLVLVGGEVEELASTDTLNISTLAASGGYPNPALAVDSVGNVTITYGWLSASHLSGGDSTLYSNGINIGQDRGSDGDAYLNLKTTTAGTYRVQLLAYSGANGGTLLRSGGTGNFNIITDDAAPIIFGTNSAIRMTITYNGNVLVGAGADTGHMLQVNGTTRLRDTKVSGTIIHDQSGGALIDRYAIQLPTLGASNTFTKLLAIRMDIASDYRNFAMMFQIMSAGSNSPGTTHVSGSLYVVTKQAGTAYHLIVSGDYSGAVYYSWDATDKVFSLWLDHNGNHNRLILDGIVYGSEYTKVSSITAAKQFMIGAISTQTDATGLTAITLGTVVTK